MIFAKDATNRHPLVAFVSINSLEGYSTAINRVGDHCSSSSKDEVIREISFCNTLKEKTVFKSKQVLLKCFSSSSKRLYVRASRYKNNVSCGCYKIYFRS